MQKKRNGFDWKEAVWNERTRFNNHGMIIIRFGQNLQRGREKVPRNFCLKMSPSLIAQVYFYL